MGKKKANGEGSISKRADGRYMGRYSANGKRHSVYGDSYEAVRQLMNEMLAEISKGAYIEPSKETVGAWMRDWLEVYALPTVKQSTYISYEAYVRLHIDPELGGIKLTALSMEQLQRFFNQKSAGTKKVRGLSPKTIRNIYNMSHSALDQAVINSKLVRNPLLGIMLLKIPERPKRALSPDEQINLQATV